MDDNKLYKALLKSQEERRQHKAQPGEARSEEQFRKERPFAGTQRRIPDLAPIVTDAADHRPTVYDPALSLGMIANPKPWTQQQLREKKIIYPGMPDKRVMDAYRELRIQLRNRAGDKGFTVMYSSLGNDSGSVLTAYNLAAAFAMDAHTSALLVDCDPHDNALPALVSSKMGSGVTDYVADAKVDIKSILYPSGVDRLTVVPAGTRVSHAVELFAAARMRDLMQELKHRYPDRCIILNTPPIRRSTEARILERFADQIVFGVPFGDVTAETAAECVDAVDPQKFAGLVFQE